MTELGISEIVQHKYNTMCNHL